MKIYLALAAVLILAAPTAAEPTLLVELHWEERLRSTNPSEAILGINARLPFTDPIFQANLSGRRCNQHVGQSFSAAPDQVDNFETVLPVQNPFTNFCARAQTRKSLKANRLASSTPIRWGRGG